MIVIRHVGGLNRSIVHPREVLKLVIVSNLASIVVVVVVVHNHPSFY
ncbi:JAB domain-containing protein [Bacillus mobilis]